MIEDLVHGWAEMECALPEYVLAEQMYEGTVDEVFASPKIRALLKESGKEFQFALIKVPVDVMDDRIELASVFDPGNEAATVRITEISVANDLEVHYSDLIHKALMYGDSYMMVWPVVDDTETDADNALVASGVEMSVHNPKNTRMFYDPEDQRRKSYVIKRWEIPSPIPGVKETLWRVELHYPDTIESWVSVAGQDLSSATGWREWVEEGEQDNILENPFGEIPFFHMRTALPYGVPVHKPGYGCQHAIRKQLVTQLASTESLGFPQRYGLIDPAGSLDAKSDGPDWNDDTDASDTTTSRGGGTGSDLRSGPGTLMAMEGYKSVGQFAAADPSNFTDPASMYIRLMAILTRTPLYSFDATGAIPSGESLKVADQPTKKKAEKLVTMFRAPVVEMWTFALLTLSVAITRLDVRWAPTESASSLSDWETVQAKQVAGVPQKQTLVEAGYEPEQVDKWLTDNTEAMDLNRRVDLLDRLGDVVQKFGTGVGLGVLSPEEAARVISQVLTDSTASEKP